MEDDEDKNFNVNEPTKSEMANKNSENQTTDLVDIGEAQTVAAAMEVVALPEEREGGPLVDENQGVVAGAGNGAVAGSAVDGGGDKNGAVVEAEVDVGGEKNEVVDEEENVVDEVVVESDVKVVGSGKIEGSCSGESRVGIEHEQELVPGLHNKAEEELIRDGEQVSIDAVGSGTIDESVVDTKDGEVMLASGENELLESEEVLEKAGENVGEENVYVEQVTMQGMPTDLKDSQVILESEKNESLISEDVVERVEENVDKEANVDMDTEKIENDNEILVEALNGNKKEVEYAESVSQAGATVEPCVVRDEIVDEVKKVLLTYEAKPEVENMTKVNEGNDNGNQEDHVHELDSGNVGDGVNDGSTENDGVAATKSLTAEIKFEEKDMHTEASKGADLSEPNNIEEKKEEAPLEGDIAAGDPNSETERGMEIEVASDVAAEEMEMADGKVKTDDREDSKMETEETRNDLDDPISELDASLAEQDEDEDTMIMEDDNCNQDTEMDLPEIGKSSGGKRKRGKNSRSTSSSKSAAKSAKRKVGEDVCFICFDGGDLVICDRRGCSKSYHPSCVNRDEAFFRSKGRWNCGWHLCSICEKNASYMCYTCTFSLCKGCIKDAIILCVRGNKGFCETCMRTIMLIEKNEQGNTDNQVDFDDKSSWEYLFKDYYIDLKSKLSLSVDEVLEAKNPWKGSDTPPDINKQELPVPQVDTNDDGGSGTDNSMENLEITTPKKRKLRKRSKSVAKEDKSVGEGLTGGDEGISSKNIEWASKELLEFVSHIKDGDTSMISQFEVQELLLEYIKRNKLRDPRRKSQIICDARLGNLFGKSRVGHIEMLKLLEPHYLTKDDQNDDVQGSVVDTESNQLDVESHDSLAKGVKDKKRKSRRKGDSRGPQSNLDDYAAIDTHNISLIYLRRKLVEDLLEESDKFHDKVVGTFVRIRIFGSTQKHDLYRLVQVVGTSKASEPYKVGKKACDTMLEILNLDKKEVIPMDTISNQEFSEEECKRLRQSIKCGLINRPTVGDILDKALELQAVRVNDWLESEILRLTHLRDRASDLGRRKELRECVEKLQLLKTPEERMRRLEEIPEIHADSNMDPTYESDEEDSETNDSRQVESFGRSRVSGFSRRGRGPISPGSDYSTKDSWGETGKVSTKTSWELSRNLSSKDMSADASHTSEMLHENSWNQGREKDRTDANNLEKLKYPTNSEAVRSSLHPMPVAESLSTVSSVSSQPSLSSHAAEAAVKINEAEKMWYYQDPSGKVQGPFSLVQLRKWSKAGYFPADLKIWLNAEKQGISVLLTDALVGKFQKELFIDPASSIQPSADNLSGHSEAWIRSNSANLPSPTPKQSNAGLVGVKAGLLTGGTQYHPASQVLQSPTTSVPNTGTKSSTPLNHDTALRSSTAFSPTPNSGVGMLVVSTDTLRALHTMTSEPHVVHQPTAIPPIHSLFNQITPVETPGGGSAPISGQRQDYGSDGLVSNIQNAAGSFSNAGAAAVSQLDLWGPQGNQSNMQQSGMSNVAWGVAPTQNNSGASVVSPETPNTGWGTTQVSPNMGWGTPTPGSSNMNWGPGVQGPATPNTSFGWVAPGGNPSAAVQGPVSGNMNPYWVTNPGWAAPAAQGPGPGNGWGPSSGNVGGPVLGSAQGNTNQGWGPPNGAAGGHVQGPAQGNTNQGWTPTSGNAGGPSQGPALGNPNQGWGQPSGNAGPIQGPAQGNQNQGWGPVQGTGQGNSNQGWGAPAGNEVWGDDKNQVWGGDKNQGWGGEENRGGGQFSGQMDSGSQGRRSGFNGGRPWNRQQSFSGGGPGGLRRFSKRDTVCPYNANGRCRKGVHCDYLHT